MFNAEFAPPTEGLSPEFIDYIERQFRAVEAGFIAALYGGMPVLYAVPDKPREGIFVNADGTSWNPGAGAGIYVYHNSTWNKIHA